MLLEKMKTGVSKIVVTILAVLLILSFALWGIEDMAGVITAPDDVASVGGSTITQREFQEEFRRDLNRLRARIGEIDADQARSLGLAESTLDSMIARRLLHMQVRDLGLLIGDDLVIREIRQQPAFRNALGQFDRAVFEATLANSGLSEAQYVASLRQDMQQDFLGGGVRSGTAVPRELADTIYRYRNEKRSADVVRIRRPAADMAPDPAEAELAVYLAENPEAFMAPEYRHLTVLYMNPADVAREMAPAPERIREEFVNRLPSLTVPEQRELEQLLFRDEEAARRAYEALETGRPFDAVAESAGQRTDLGLVSPGDLLPGIAEAAFALERGGFTQPVETPLGWHIVRVRKIEPGRQPAFEEVRDEISRDLSRDLALDELVRQANRVEDTLAGGATIEEAAAETGSRILKPGPIDAAMKLPSGEPAEGLPDDPRFIEIAFSTDEGATSRLTETADGGYFMLRVDDIVPSARQPLDKVRDAVAAAWRKEKLDAIARESAEQVLDEARSGKALSAVARERGLIVESGKPVTRFASAQDTVIPPAILPDLFDAREGDYVLGETVDGFAVARLTDIRPAAADPENPEYRQLVDTLSDALSNDVMQEYTRALRDEYAVSVNRAALDAYFANRP